MVCGSKGKNLNRKLVLDFLAPILYEINSVPLQAVIGSEAAALRNVGQGSSWVSPFWRANLVELCEIFGIRLLRRFGLGAGMNTPKNKD